MRIGMLTGGGDCPGLNAVISAVVRKGGTHYADDVVGFLDGWLGVIENRSMVLDWDRCRNILFQGGTILGSSRTNVFKVEGGLEKVRATLKDKRIDALVAIGGDDTLGVADKLTAEGIAVVGVPKTIDNDLSATEVTFGFHTAVQIATEAIDRLRTTSESHSRVMVCEVMGRHAGWIALYSGIAGGAVDVLIPEEPFDVDVVCERLRPTGARTGRLGRGRGRRSHPQGGLVQRHLQRSGPIRPRPPRRLGQHAGLGDRTAHRVRDPGHCSRPHPARRTPVAFDRVLATRFGFAAIDAVHHGGAGTMVALQADRIVRVPLNDRGIGTQACAPRVLRAGGQAAVRVRVAGRARRPQPAVPGAPARPCALRTRSPRGLLSDGVVASRTSPGSIVSTAPASWQITRPAAQSQLFRWAS